ncbi:MAG TPA: hypothetical protein VNI53_03115 [Gammaproteobacteria bacterium]|nr:hypothetical protein [Gammaproteobacteria bacterium]
MNYLHNRPFAASMGAGASSFCFDEALFRELLTCLQAHPLSGVEPVGFVCINGGCTAVYDADVDNSACTLWLYEDDVREWFIARYTHDMQQMQEIEQEILAEFGAQLMEQRLNDSQKYHAAVTQAV